MSGKDNYHLQEKYEYELPGEPLNPSDEPLGRSLFTHPSVVPPDTELMDPNKNISFKLLRPWFIACAFMLIFGLIFEFGFLGKDGKQGSLCKYLPQNKVCYYLAGVPPKSTAPPNT